MRRRPAVITYCVADRYHGPMERIVEFASTKGGNGGLIAIHEADDGTLSVDLYRLQGVRVNKPTTDEKGS